MRLLLSLLLLAGCDRLFGLADLVDRPDDDEGIDASITGAPDARPGCTLDTFSRGMIGFSELWNREHMPPRSEVVVESDKLAIKIAPTAAEFGYAFTTSAYDLTGATISVRVDQVIGAGNAETFFDLENEAMDYYEFSYSNGMLRMYLYRDDMIEQNKTIPYDPMLHAYWRFQHIPARNAVAFFTSPDAVSWIEHHSIPTSVAVVALFPGVGAGIYSGSVPDGVSIFDDFELCR
ncbi:MAG TPA: hypothetical protein VIV11_34505 [Kofleriaceae bacterium]